MELFVLLICQKRRVVFDQFLIKVLISNQQLLTFCLIDYYEVQTKLTTADRPMLIMYLMMLFKVKQLESLINNKKINKTLKKFIFYSKRFDFSNVSYSKDFHSKLKFCFFARVLITCVSTRYFSDLFDIKINKFISLNLILINKYQCQLCNIFPLIIYFRQFFPCKKFL